MIYADDTQVYIILKKHYSDTAIQGLELCLHDIEAWCVHKKMVLKDGKTETILHSILLIEIEKLQHVPNTAARNVKRSNRREHITPISTDLHWPPIQSHIKFKLALIVFKALNNLAPSFLQAFWNYISLRSALPFEHGQ